MNKREALFQRVKDSALALDGLLRGPSNVPIGDYLDGPSMDGLVNSLSLGVDEWKPADLEAVLIIRDGFYEMRHAARDRNDDSEHSLEQILSALDRLYADLDRLLKEPEFQEIAVAKDNISNLHASRSVQGSLFTGALKNLDRQATEVLIRTAVTLRHTEVVLTKIGSGAAEGILKQIRLSVRRLNASVFALKISMEQSTIYEGVFSFLHARSDDIIGGINSLVQGLRDTYATSTEFLSQLRDLSSVSERFTQKVGEFINRAFVDLIEPETNFRFRLQSYEVREAVYCAGEASDGLVILAGQGGSFQLADATRARSERVAKMTLSDVLSVVQIDRREYALGTVSGLQIARAGLSLEAESHVVEQVTSVALMRDWGNEGVVVTGSRDGVLRQYSLADVYRGRPNPGRESRRKRSRIVKLLPVGKMLWVAAGQELEMLDASFALKGKVTVPFQLRDIALHVDGSLLACGTGSIAHITSDRGPLARSLTTEGGAHYVAVVPLNEDAVCVVTKDGVVSAVDLNTHEELGSLDLSFPVSGIVRAERKLIAFGGNSREGKAIAYILYDQTTTIPGAQNE